MRELIIYLLGKFVERNQDEGHTPAAVSDPSFGMKRTFGGGNMSGENVVIGNFP